MNPFTLSPHEKQKKKGIKVVFDIFGVNGSNEIKEDTNRKKEFKIGMRWSILK